VLERLKDREQNAYTNQLGRGSKGRGERGGDERYTKGWKNIGQNMKWNDIKT